MCVGGFGHINLPVVALPPLPFLPSPCFADFWLKKSPEEAASPLFHHSPRQHRLLPAPLIRAGVDFCQPNIKRKQNLCWHLVRFAIAFPPSPPPFFAFFFLFFFTRKHVCVRVCVCRKFVCVSTGEDIAMLWKDLLSFFWVCCCCCCCCHSVCKKYVQAN